MPKLSLKSYNKFSRPRFLRLLSVIILKLYTKILLRLRINAYGVLPKGPKIFAINHPTTADPFIIYSLYPNAKVLIAEKVFKVKILGYILRKLGHIPVGEESGREAFNMAKDVLLNGGDIIIFPEGTLSKDVSTMERVRTGLARLALESNSTIVPIGVNIKKEGIRKYRIKNNAGETLVSHWYLFNKYIINIGKSIKLKGSIENREYVRKRSLYLQLEIQRLSRRYFYNTH